MKGQLYALLEGVERSANAVNVLREYLQGRVLRALEQQGAMSSLAFLGGTCLRFVFNIERYSQDLDFTLEHNADTYDFERYLKALGKHLGREGYAVEFAQVSRKTNVHKAFLRFADVLYESGLSAHPAQKLSVRLEIDVRPPEGAGTAVSRASQLVFPDSLPLHLQHHDRSSLFAGKVAAVLQRPYTKGRDLYDLHWYLRNPNWPEPNIPLLNASLAQRDGGHVLLTAATWRATLMKRLDELDWDRARADVGRFLINPHHSALINREAILDAARHWASRLPLQTALPVPKTSM